MEIVQISTDSFNSMCRTCLAAADTTVFQIAFEGIQLVEMFEKFTTIQMNENDHLPHKICNSCINEMLRFYKFRTKCLETHAVLTKFIAHEEDRKLNTVIEIKAEKLEISDVHDNRLESGIEQSSHAESVNRSTSNQGWTDDKKLSSSANRLTETICYVCNISFESRQALVLHRGEPGHPKGSKTLVDCPICSKPVMLVSMKQHMRTHSQQQRAYKCNVCERSFSRPSNLNQHQLIHMNQKQFACDICGKGFSRKQHKNDHMLMHARQKLYTCKDCEQRFNNLSDLRKHKLRECDKRLTEFVGEVLMAEQLRCDDCEAVFSNQYDLNEHIQVHKVKVEAEMIDGDHLDLERGSDNSISKNEDYNLTTGLQKIKRAQLEIPNKVSPKNKTVQTVTKTRRTTTMCYVCNIKFDDHDELVAHRHEASHPKAFKAVVPCPICLKPTIAKRMKLHLFRHSAEKSFVCNVCGKGFKYPRTLRRHAHIHTADGEKPFKCDVCGTGFTQAQTRKAHMRVHAKGDQDQPKPDKMSPEKTVAEDKPKTQIAVLAEHEKPFLCHHCGKRLSSKLAYESHILAHEGIKPYPCTVCGRLFRQVSVLEMHKMTHRGERPHSCKICKKSFVRRNHLRCHMKLIHSTERPFVCIHCGKGFALKFSLSAHLKTHTGETPYTCDYCGRAFSSSNNMNKHKRSQHGDEKSAQQSVATSYEG